ncbi:MAG: peptide deformylase [Betaproteobacteria bacterium]
MALLSILRYPDERLHKIAAPVEVVNDEVRHLIRDMAETMYAAPGVGLAATQVDVHKRIIVIDISEAHDDLLVLINPTIVDRRGQSNLEEGCLSVPGIFDQIERSEWVKVHALNAEGNTYEVEADGLLAVCIQHEMDHLEGIVFVEHLSRLKQGRILAKIKKQEKQQRRAL